MVNSRLNGILTTLSQQYAYHLLPNAPQGETRLRYLADGLANRGFLVIVADIPANNYDMLLKTWIDGYNRFYGIVCRTLFPMFTSINLGTADGMRPPVVVIQGESPAVIQAMADYVVPYVALRQRTNAISDAEIIGLMTYILDELEADELPRRTYDNLQRQSAQIIRQLITLPVNQYSLTAMKKPLFQNNHTQPRDLPRQKPRPVPPKSLPETGELNPNTLNMNGTGKQGKPRPDRERDKTQPMPIWWNIEDDLERTNRQPPINDDDL
ncbi:MAG: hypothetical protein AAFV93_05300 [Chloroflexota bacterium]